ncbi:MAG: hypothetical protein IK152_01375 [Lachnospiraceae bacterium]|nr:hypothetical protein [Lachnospiraceae bacterium]
MKRIKKTVTSILAVCLALFMMAGCAAPAGGAGGSSAAAAVSSSQAPKEIKATDYVLAFHKYLCTGDKKAAEDVKMQSDVMKEIEEVRSKMDNIGELMAESLDSDMADLVDKNSVTEFASALSGVLSRVTATATEESSSGDKVKVKISSDTIDMTSIGQAAVIGAIAGLTSASSKEEISKAVNKILISMADGLYKYEFPKEKKSAVVEVKKSGDSWEFVDYDEAGTAITELILSMEGLY